MRDIKVILEKNLPPEEARDLNTIYFLYDSLIVYLGQRAYDNPFIIVEKIPDTPATGIMYFDLSDGYAKIYYDYKMTNIGKINTDNELDLLKKTGHTFFFNSQERYLDRTKRTLILPYKNGIYELAVSLREDTQINEYSVIQYNKSTGCFELKSESYNNEEFFSDYTGINTPSVNVDIDSGKLKADVKISSYGNNILTLLNDGLYVGNPSALTLEEFNSWKKQFEKYKIEMETYISNLKTSISKIEQVVDPENLGDTVIQILQSEIPNIKDSIDKIDAVEQELNEIEAKVKQYADTKYNETYEELAQHIREVTENPWSEI